MPAHLGIGARRYVIPTPVVEHFLTDYETTNTFTGFPMMGVAWQTMESPAMRSVLRMKPEHSGVRSCPRAIRGQTHAAPTLSEHSVGQAYNG